MKASANNRTTVPVAPVLACAVAAALVNLFGLVPLFGALTLHFGQAFALVALVIYGLRAGLFVSATAGLTFWWASGAWAMPPLLMLETAAIAALMARRLILVPAAVAFWLAIGLPLNYAMAVYWLQIPEDVLHISVIKQGVNGLLNATLASGLVQLLITTTAVGPASPRLRMSLRRQVFAISVMLVVLPALLIAVFLVNRSVVALGAELERGLQQTAHDYALITEMHLDRHRSAIELLAGRFPGEVTAEYFADLDRVEAAHPGFLTMLIADAEGAVVHGAPASFFDRLAGVPEAARNVADRDYFRVPRDSGSAYVSDGFVGRGFGNDPIVAVSAPLRAADGSFRGVVEGSLSLPRFSDLDSMRNAADAMLVLDGSGQRVYASERLDIAPLAEVELQAVFSRRLVDVPQVQFAGERYFVAEAGTEQGWTVYALTHTSVLAAPVNRFMVGFGIALIVLVAIGAWFARLLASDITQPLDTLSRQILDAKAERIVLPPEQQKSPEIVRVSEALDQARRMSLRFQKELEQEVEAKTAELKAMNVKLGQLAIGDPLTGLLNRRGFEVKAGAVLDAISRDSPTVVLAMIDIDHFKPINDRFGHAVGDGCLRQLAKQMRSAFRRRRDLVGRIGGEEFAILTIRDDEDDPFERLEVLRSAIEAEQFRIDGETVQMTVSMGAVRCRPGDQVVLSELMAAADKQLYISKRNGRNRLSTGDYRPSPG
jgi:diguanylate cyclase (GGDEF)-like protein